MPVGTIAADDPAVFSNLGHPVEGVALPRGPGFLRISERDAIRIPRICFLHNETTGATVVTLPPTEMAY